MTTAMPTSPDQSLLHRGTGPVATVYMTAPPAGGRAQAVKIYPAGLDRATATELLDEQRTLAALRSVSSILLIDRLEDLPDGRAALWMELCAQSLAELVQVGGPLPVPDVLGLAEPLAAVLAGAHSAGIVHGGVTPSNVLFRPAGQPVLADFGLGLRQRFPRQPEGAAAYTAPEVLRGAEPGPAADLYGLGAVLHFALTGSSPFPSRAGEPAGEVLLRALSEPPPMVSGQDLPDGLPALVTALLAKDPSDRPGSAAEVLEAVRALAGPAGGSAAAGADDDSGPDFDDFRDALPAPRASIAGTPVAGPPDLGVPPAPPLAAPGGPGAPVVPPAEQPGKRPGRRPGGRWQPHPALLAGVAVLAVVIVLVGALGRGGDSKPAAPTPSAPPRQEPVAVPSRTPEATPVPASNQLEIHQLADHGSTVTLAWRGPKPLTYAVWVAEQGKPKGLVRYRGSATTLTVEVQPGLKYCFLVQGTDGTRTYESPPRSLRGATCRN